MQQKSAYERVYTVQCKTAAVLNKIWGLEGDIATKGSHPLLLFRLLPPYRNKQSLEIRKMVSDKVRQQRREKCLMS